MGRERVVAAIDIGTTKVVALVGQQSAEDGVQVLGVGVAPSKGMKKGVVVNLEEAAEAIRYAVDRAERSSGYQIVSAHVGIAGSHVSSLNNRGVVTVTTPDRIITEEDVDRAIESARAINIPANREIIHVLPRAYTIDGQEGIQNPIGMYGFRLDVEVHIVTAAATAIQNLVEAVRRAGVEVDDIVLQSLASAEAVVSAEEREIGVVLADVGGGTTDICVFVEGQAWHSAVLPIGGNHITNDVAIALRTPLHSAERLKVAYGRAISSEVDHREMIEAAAFGSEGSREVSAKHLSEIIESRSIEMVQLIVAEQKRSGYDGMLPAGLVLTGGTANLPDLDVLASEVLQGPVRIGRPAGVQGLVDAISGPAYSTGVGLLLWALRHGEVQPSTMKRMPEVGGIARWFSGLVREFLPQ